MSASTQLCYCMKLTKRLIPQFGLHNVNATGMRQLSSNHCYAFVQQEAVKLCPLVQRYKFNCHKAQQNHFGVRDTTFEPYIHASSCARFYSSDSADKQKTESKSSAISDDKPQVKETLWQRFKKMYKEYWYVLLPVHCATSVVWYGSFYYIARSGIDIVPMLESLGASELIVKPLRDTGAGFFAVAYAMYKIATPARYTVTLGGTTITINYLKKWGYIKPMPSSEAMKEMIREKGRQLRSHRAKVLAKMNLRRKGTPKPKQPNQNASDKDKS